MNNWNNNDLTDALKRNNEIYGSQLIAAIYENNIFNSFTGFQKMILSLYHFGNEVKFMTEMYLNHGQFQSISQVSDHNHIYFKDLLVLDLPYQQINEKPSISNQREALGWLYISEYNHYFIGHLFKDVLFDVDDCYTKTLLINDEQSKLRHWNALNHKLDRLYFSPFDQQQIINGAQQAAHRFINLLHFEWMTDDEHIE